MEMMNDDALVENQRILSAIESVDNATSANPLDGFQKTERNDNNSSPKMRARTAMLQGPILSTIVKLALPTIVVLLVQTLVGVAEVYYVGLLGVVALAGTALVFPFWSLMTMVSNGGMGSGVSSAIARAIGADRHDDADALVFHGLVLAIVLGLFFQSARGCLDRPCSLYWVGVARRSVSRFATHDISSLAPYRSG